jgi:hypothetical protein
MALDNLSTPNNYTIYINKAGFNNTDYTIYPYLNTGLLNTPLTVYAYNSSYPVVFSGSILNFTNSSTITLSYSRIGNIVTIQFPSMVFNKITFSGSFPSSGNLQTIPGYALPVGIAPRNTTKSCAIICTDSSLITTVPTTAADVNWVAHCNIQTDGNIAFYKSFQNTAITSPITPQQTNFLQGITSTVAFPYSNLQILNFSISYDVNAI